MAFMLEATFLGIFVFGRERVGNALYMVSAIAVGLGTWLSAVWILIANSWMQTPRGYELATENGQTIVQLVDPVAAYANPRFPWMFVHMQNAAVESVALFMAGIGAYFVFKHHVGRIRSRKSGSGRRRSNSASSHCSSPRRYRCFTAIYTLDTSSRPSRRSSLRWRPSGRPTLMSPSTSSRSRRVFRTYWTRGRRTSSVSAFPAGRRRGSPAAAIRRRPYRVSRSSMAHSRPSRSSSGRSGSWSRWASGSSCSPSGEATAGGGANSSKTTSSTRR